jgi:hypothetical protein
MRLLSCANAEILALEAGHAATRVKRIQFGMAYDKNISPVGWYLGS